MFRVLRRRVVPIGGMPRRRPRGEQTPSDRPYDFEGSAREMPANGPPGSEHAPDDPPRRLPPS
jgi:hypothetical protein